ncbi:putative protein isoform X4 [Capsicum annuum]
MGTVSSGIGFLSQFFASDYAASTHQFCCFSANSSPLHVNFSRSAAGCLVKRSSLLSSRVSVLTAGNSKIDGVDDQLSLSSDEIKPARSRVVELLCRLLCPGGYKSKCVTAGLEKQLSQWT